MGVRLKVFLRISIVAARCVKARALDLDLFIQHNVDDKGSGPFQIGIKDTDKGEESVL